MTPTENRDTEARDRAKENIILEMGNQAFDAWDELDGSILTEDIPQRDTFAVGFLQGHKAATEAGEAVCEVKAECAGLYEEAKRLREREKKLHGNQKFLETTLSEALRTLESIQQKANEYLNELKLRSGNNL